MKKILISAALISILIIPAIGLAKEAIELTKPDCTVEHDLSNYSVCCTTGLFGKVGTQMCLGVVDDVIDDTASWSAATVAGTGKREEFSQCCLIDKILTVGDYIFVAILVVAILVILFAAFTFLTAAGSPDKITKARNLLIYGIIGVAVAFLAGKLLVRVIAAIMA